MQKEKHKTQHDHRNRQVPASLLLIYHLHCNSGADPSTGGPRGPPIDQN